MAAVFHSLGDLRIGQFTVDVERHCRLADVVAEVRLVSLEAPVGTRVEYIVVDHINLAQQARILPAFTAFDDDEIIDRLRVEATQDTFENELVVVEIIITYPNFTLVPFVERGERVDIIDDDALVVSDGVDDYDHPIVFENFEVVEIEHRRT